MGQGAYIFGCADTCLSLTEKSFYRDAQPWGFILFARNIDNPDQLRRLTGDLRDTVGFDAPVLIDQEGGRVQRMRAPHWREWLPPIEQCNAAGSGAARSMWLRYRIIADELHAVGIDVNCAPVADILGPQTHATLANRCYGQDANTVIEIARAVADGMLAGGVLPILKHIPGHGRSRVDSHLSLPEVAVPQALLRASDFATFGALSDLPMAMSAHVLYSDIDDRAVTCSPRMIRLIRDEIGFGGLLMSDDLSMEALGGTLADRSRAALAAGCDLVLHCNGQLDEMQDIAGATGTMNDRAQRRGARAIAQRRAPEAIDIAACEAELQALTGGHAYV